MMRRLIRIGPVASFIDLFSADRVPGNLGSLLGSSADRAGPRSLQSRSGHRAPTGLVGSRGRSGKNEAFLLKRGRRASAISDWEGGIKAVEKVTRVIRC